MTTFELARDTGPGGRPAPDVLAWSQDAAGLVLRPVVARMSLPIRRVASYHFGWCDVHGDPTESGGGKALRPALALLSARAVGGAGLAGLPAAVAVELVHNYSLLHDDVMDGDEIRRHRPTAWRAFGVPAALLAGNGLLAAAFEVLAEHRAAVTVLSKAVLELLDGQAADLAMPRRTGVTVEDCLRMAGGKTGALMGCACALGAMLGGGKPRQVEHVRAFGRHLGVVFQLRDDLLDIWGDPARTGKPARSDLVGRRMTLPVVAALISGTDAAEELAALYRTGSPLSGREVARAAELVEVAGGRRWAERELAGRLGQALERLAAADPSASAAGELAALAALAAGRDS